MSQRRASLSLRQSKSLPAPPRRRKSLEHEPMTRASSFSRRRLDKQPPRVASMAQLLLDHVHVEFIRVVVAGKNRLASPRFVMRVSHTALHQSWEMARTFKEFCELKEAVIRVLDHGHFCPSNCPWLYMFAAHEFPRRRIFRSRRPSVIAGRLAALQTYVSTLLRMAKQSRNLDCRVSSTRLPQLLYDFLFEGMVFGPSDWTRLSEQRLSLAARDSSFLDSSDPTQELDDDCFLCRQALLADDQCVSIVAAGPGSARGDTTGDSCAMAGLTTLPCGHCFHDECILEKLNESLLCPRCATRASSPLSRARGH